MPRFRPDALIDFAAALLATAGLEQGHARTVANTLLAGDLLGHGSHGIGLVGRNLDEIAAGETTRSGMPELVRDGGATLLFDGRMLPGPVVVTAAVAAGLDRLAVHGTVTAVIRRSGHIACLGAYLEAATRRGVLIVIASSNPWACLVAPFGARRPVYSPDPIACGIPTPGDPILIDLSMSQISVNVCREYHERGERLPGDYLLDSQGKPTSDPGVLFARSPDPVGSVMPLGGPEFGYKGFALGLMVEALTAALGGFGRSDRPQATNNAVFIQLIDPDAFGGRDFMIRETGWLAQACRDAPTAAGEQVRLPGERALAYRRRALADGLEIDARVMTSLAKWGQKLGVCVPVALDDAV